MPDIGSIWAEFSPLLPPMWENIKGFANSSFTTSLAGAFAGAVAAQRIAEKGKFREELVKEFHNTNAVLSLAAAAATLALALKKQHVKALKDSYDDDLKRFKEHKEKILGHQTPPNTPFEMRPNLLYLDGISPPIATIQDIVLSRLSSVGRTISAVTALADSVKNLNSALSRRNELLNAFKSKQFPEGASFEHMYLGLPYGTRQTNQEYGGSVEAIHLYTNDIIFFSIKLCEDLRDHGEILKKRYKSRLRGIPPRISTVDFDTPRKDGLVPKDEDYEAWLSGFVTMQEIKPTWRQRLNPMTWFN
ncbi:hypothetical protein DLD99_07430 [Pseudomonas kribbensis]|uniref:Uncharacterized protein n=1 Tax=Pseudomonas kribbensis TaxID=1628086 RepID=A0A345RLY9_9PSED|nr:hypothetical protein [Pseudomonas kribbensis]AXI60305.1 hypothetical protein DLD99_07430 [Pseudomonas kribbensis]